MRSQSFAAVDLGASSGRVMRGTVGSDELRLAEVHRFRNRPRTTRGVLRWDFADLEQQVRAGLRRAGPVAGIGVDGWAVDYGLLDDGGRLLEDPVHYRDARTDGVPEQVFQHISAARLYSLTGVQDQQFTTIHQLYAARNDASFEAAARILLFPDLLVHSLTGTAGTEITNASTTGLLDPVSRQWSGEIADALGIDPGLFAPLREPGDPAGLAADFDAPVYAVASHDTASAVAAVPASGEHFAYISSGTWSLVGVELSAPVRTAASQKANFTNELGVDGTVRYLRNVMGLWLLQECLRAWSCEDDLAALLEAASHTPARRSVIDATDPVFLAPDGMPDRIDAACRASGQPVPRSRAETVRCVLDSLAEAYRRAVQEASELSGARVEVVHLVGGGTHNTLLCQLTADAIGLPVIAGPAEAAAIGNLLIQARTVGAVRGGLDDLRALVARTQPLRRYEPSCG